MFFYFLICLLFCSRSEYLAASDWDGWLLAKEGAGNFIFFSLNIFDSAHVLKKTLIDIQ